MRLVPPESKTIKSILKEFNTYYCANFSDKSVSHRIKTHFDVIVCYFKYGAWINNYFEYKFWEKTPLERSSFLTWKKAIRFINSVNGEGHNPVFRNKHLFLKEFSSFVYRDWLYVPDSTFEQFEEFLKKHDFVMEKCDSGMFGIGVSKIDTKSITDIKKYFCYANQNKILLEECIEECAILKNVHDKSLNTIRVVTLLDSDGTNSNIIGTVFRMGNNGSVVDNARADGIFATVDYESGVVISDGVDFLNHKFENHPYSDKKIKGLVVPAWSQVIDVCKNAAKKHPETRFVGWDVVVREDNNNYYVELIEGNDRPGVPTLQTPLQKGIYWRVNNEVENNC